MTRRRFTAFVEALTQNRRPRGFRASPEDARALKAAIELSVVRADETAPSPQFVSDLRDRLRHELDEAPAMARRPRVSRRLLLGGAGVAASGAGVAVAIDRTAFAPSGQPPLQSAQQPMSPDRGSWIAVATVASLRDGGPTRFETRSAVGFVTNDAGTLSAVSGVCTHQGCLLQPNPAARRLDCPCHRTAFSVSGAVLFAELPIRPSPLPRLQVRQQGEQVQVFLPPPI